MILTLITAFLASSGLWAYLQTKDTRKDARLKLLLGIAHEMIISRGRMYISRGWITYDEYEDFNKYLYGPYSAFGGNGLAERVVKEVNNLQIRHTAPPLNECEVE